MSKTVGMITARLKSTRLPKKALLPIAGRALIDHLTDRLVRMATLDEICLCTSDLKEDEPLRHWAMARGLQVYAGDPEDVLARLYGASIARSADTLFCVTGDNPFVSPHHGDALLAFHMRGNFDYSRTAGIPIGTYGYALGRSALKQVCDTKADTDTEIWGPYFTQSGKFRCGTLNFPVRHFKGRELRLTVDTAEDFQLAQRILSELCANPALVSLQDIYEWVDKKGPENLPNLHVIQKPQPTPRFRT